MIKVNNLTKIFNNNKNDQVTALDSFSFNINEGEVVSIVGKSGSGKTTLGNILLGILKPTSGTFEIDGKIYDKKSKKRKLRLITNSLLSSFQYPTHQLFTTTVKDEMLFNAKDESKIDELVRLFNFPKELLSANPFRLSSGQKRKVILMSLLMSEPKILIFDEATAFLDAASRREFISLTKEINSKYKTTMVFISHNIEDVKSFSDRTILIDGGKLIKDGNTSEVVDHYLGGDSNATH